MPVIYRVQLTIVICLLIAAPVWAQTPFRRGTGDFELSGAYTQPIRFSRERLSSGTVGLGYYLVDNVSLIAEISGVYVDQGWRWDKFESDTAGAALTARLRWHFIATEAFSLYVDTGGGGVQYSTPSPPGGTRFNFIANGGAGATVRLAEHLHLLGGLRYLHYSNANLHTRQRNPTYDGMQFYGGLMWTF